MSEKETQSIQPQQPENYIEVYWKKIFRFLLWLGKKIMKLSMKFGEWMYKVGERQAKEMDKRYGK